MIDRILAIFGLERKGVKKYQRISCSQEADGEVFYIYCYVSNPKYVAHKEVWGSKERRDMQIKLAKREGYDSLIIQKNYKKFDLEVFSDSQVCVLKGSEVLDG